MVDLDCARWNYQDPYTIDPEEFRLNVIGLDPASSGIRLSSVLFSRGLLCLTTGEFQVSLQIRATLRDRVRAIDSDIRLASRKQCSQIRRSYYAPSFRSMNQLIRSARRLERVVHCPLGNVTFKSLPLQFPLCWHFRDDYFRSEQRDRCSACSVDFESAFLPSSRALTRRCLRDYFIIPPHLRPVPH